MRTQRVLEMRLAAEMLPGPISHPAANKILLVEMGGVIETMKVEDQARPSDERSANLSAYFAHLAFGCLFRETSL
jgi:hypothetical protein